MNDEESAPDYVDHVLRNHYPEHFHPSQVSLNLQMIVTFVTKTIEYEKLKTF